MLPYFRAPAKQSISGCSSVGRVRVWGTCGRWFESSHPDKVESVSYAFHFFLSYRPLLEGDRLLVCRFLFDLDDANSAQSALGRLDI